MPKFFTYFRQYFSGILNLVTSTTLLFGIFFVIFSDTLAIDSVSEAAITPVAENDTTISYEVIEDPTNNQQSEPLASEEEREAALNQSPIPTNLPDASYIPGQVIILETGTTSQKLNEAFDVNDFIKATEANEARTSQIFYSPSLAARAQTQTDGVEYQENTLAQAGIAGFSNVTFETTTSFDDPQFPSQYHLQETTNPNINMMKNITNGRTCQNVRVAVLDSGTDLNHPDLKNQLGGLTGLDVYGYDYVDNDWTPHDTVNGHGTHVAGIIAAQSNNNIGIASPCPDAEIVTLRTINETGGGSTTDMYDALKAAIDNNVDVVNMSFRAKIDSSWTSFISSFENLFIEARQNGVTLVAAAGNDYSPITDGTSMIFPASSDNVITVANVNANGTKYWSSNYGPEVDVSAFGVNIRSTMPNNSYKMATGTSMSSPLVSAMAAQVISTTGITNPAEVEQMLKQGATPLPDNRLGAGLVNLCNSIKCGDKAPITSDDFLVVEHGTELSAEDSILNNDDLGDYYPNVLKVDILQQPLEGSLSFGPGGALTYTANDYTTQDHNFDEFVYRLKYADGEYSNEATVKLNISYPAPENLAPDAPQPTYIEMYSTQQSVSFNMMGAFSDPDMNSTNIHMPKSHKFIDPTSITIAEAPTYGTITNNDNGSLTYTFTHVGDQSEYNEYLLVSVADRAGKQSAGYGLLQITITNIVQPPTTVQDTIITQKNQSVQFNVLDNDIDPAGFDLYLTSVTTPHNGGLNYLGSGYVSYQPNANFVGTDVFLYTIENSGGQQASNIIVVEVHGDIDAVYLNNGLYPMLEYTTDQGDGTYKAVFGYHNRTDSTLNVAPGDGFNDFNTPNPDQGQITEFLPGRNFSAFEVIIPCGQSMTWKLGSPTHNESRTALAENPCKNI
jgi:subtilisin family serine protease